MPSVSALRLPPPFEPCGEHIGVTLGDARALFTTRRGGRSRGPYASLNLGVLTDDDPAAVAANRALVEREHAVRLAFGHQVHGARVARRDAAGSGAGPDAEVDGHATAVPGVAPAVLSADCLTVAIAAPGAVAAVHAGWRGLAAGVIAAGVRAVRELGHDGPLQAAIGPGAGVCCYDVGEEVHARFAAHGAGARRGRHLDLKAIAARQLEAGGVATVHDLGLCTICSDPGLFFSHRRDHGTTGRQGGLVWLSR